MRNVTFVSTFFLLVICSFTFGIMDRQSFYEALSSGSEEQIDKEMARLDSQKKTSYVKACLGAVKMKKAGFLKGAGNKVKVFKQGALLLEEEIKSNPENTEYRFIRLTVQENAPKILKYNKNLDEDKKVILSGFNKMEPDLKLIVRTYAGNSKIIKEGDLK